MNFKEFDNPREKPQVRPVTTMDPKEFDDRIEKAKAKAYKKPEGPDLSQLWAKEKPATEDGMTSADVDRVKNQNFTDKQIKHAYRVLNHPSVKGGNYTAAYNIINRIAPGLADHPDVANALKRANEGFIGKKTEYNDFLQNKLDTAIQEYDTPEKKAERDALMQKYLNKGGKIKKVPTGKTAYKNKELKPAYKKDNGTPITSPMSDESVEEDGGDTRMEDALIKKFGEDKAKVIMDFAYAMNTDSSEEIMKSHGLTFKGDTEDDKRWFQKYPWLAQLDNKPWMGRLFDIAGQGPDYGTPKNMGDESVEEDINEKGRIVLEKAGFDPNAIHEYMAVFNDHGDTSELEDMNRNKIGVADAMAMVLASHDVENESAIKEDGPPFGSGMELVRMALMKKFITADEWFHLKDKWNAAADEIEQRYGDWPEGEGFGSSDHNFAIKELMGLVGYEFDEQDRSGSFIVTKVPPEIEKAGIKNARMKKEAEINERMPASVIQHKQKLAYMSDEELANRFKDYDETRLRKMAWSHGYGKMGSHYIDRIRNHMTSKRTGTTEERGPGFAVRYSLNGERKVQAYKTEKDAQHRAEILRSMGGVKDVSITTHTLNFKKESAYESKLTTMLNQRLK